MNRRLAIFLIVSIAVVFLIANVTIFGYRYVTTPVVQTDFHFIMAKGGSIRSLSRALHKRGDLEFPQLFEWYARLNGDATHLKYGEYVFSAGSSINDLLRQMIQGKIVYHAFTLVDGWNIYDVMNALKSQPYLSHRLLGDSPQQIAQQMKISNHSPEGLLFPDTYYYTMGTADLTLIDRAYAEMQSYVNNAWSNREKDLPYRDAYQALIVASMVEKETSLDSERPIIAGIILKRLKIWMPLQIDSTVIYGLEPNFDGHLSRKDLRYKTPYNSYTNYGLPITPISMPGAMSIQAALHPEKTDAMYFVAKGDVQGSHQFSATLGLQRKAVKKYQLNNGEIKSNE